MSDAIVPWLFGFTLIIALVYAAWQAWSTRQAQKHHEHSVMPPPEQHPTREPVHEPMHTEARDPRREQRRETA